MNFLGFDIAFRSPVESLSIVPRAAIPAGLQTVRSQSSWLHSWWGGPVHEPFTGAWQRNITEDSQTSLLAFSAVFACVTGIASDIAKMRIKLSRNNDGIWEEITQHQPWLPLLRKPNHFQTRIEFVEQWIVSKLLHGNAYILKQRNDERKLVTALYVLDPTRVTPLVATDGSVYYQLKRDHLGQVTDDRDGVIVPASEIIHDRMVCLWHPLVGVSPLYACATSTTMGNRIQSNSTNAFANASRPGGVLTAPGHIADDTAARLKSAFEANFSGANVGRLAVLGDGLKFEPMMLAPEVMQLVEQLRFTVEDVGRAFHYPQDKLGGPVPPYSSNAEARTMVYYMDCLQPHIEKMELCLDEGLELPSGIGTEMDLDNLWRMDSNALADANAKGVGSGVVAPNEARFRANLGPVEGGDSPFLQQQNYSLSALAKRDAQDDPFQTATPPAPANPPADTTPSAKHIQHIKSHSATRLTKELVPV